MPDQVSTDLIRQALDGVDPEKTTPDGHAENNIQV
jgi:hypothetical protein